MDITYQLTVVRSRYYAIAREPEAEAWLHDDTNDDDDDDDDDDNDNNDDYDDYDADICRCQWWSCWWSSWREW